MAVILWAGFLVACFALGKAEIKGLATCDNHMKLYIDGVYTPVAHQDAWNVAGAVTLPDDWEVLAISCRDSGGLAGIMAQFEGDDGPDTDASWSCSTDCTKGWNQPAASDVGGWDSAHVIDNMQDLKGWGGNPTNMATAKWIWTDKYRYNEDGDRDVCCRITRNPGRKIGLELTCDDYMQLMVDGNPVMYDAGWESMDYVVLPSTTQVIGIACLDGAVQGGIMARVSTGVVTDDSWKCTEDYFEGWANIDYDDSAWPAAHVISENIWSSRPVELYGIAEWIWTPRYKFQDKVVYCRKTLEPLTPPVAPLTDSCVAGTESLKSDLSDVISGHQDKAKEHVEEAFAKVMDKLDALPDTVTTFLGNIRDALKCMCPSRRR